MALSKSERIELAEGIAYEHLRDGIEYSDVYEDEDVLEATDDEDDFRAIHNFVNKMLDECAGQL